MLFLWHHSLDGSAARSSCGTTRTSTAPAAGTGTGQLQRKEHAMQLNEKICDTTCQLWQQAVESQLWQQLPLTQRVQ